MNIDDDCNDHFTTTKIQSIFFRHLTNKTKKINAVPVGFLCGMHIIPLFCFIVIFLTHKCDKRSTKSISLNKFIDRCDEQEIKFHEDWKC